MGLVVPKFRSSAVARNRLRRRLKEIWRRDVQPLQGGRDLVIRIRREAYAASFASLREQVMGWSVAVLGVGGPENGEGEDGR